MANYPSYYPNNQMPTYQPMYGQQYQNFQPPYQQNVVQPQMQMPQPQQTAEMRTMVVDDFSTLTANDVSMVGNGSVFIKRDGTEIQWRRWGNMGNIEMTSYKPILEQNSQDNTNTPQMDFNALYEDVKAIRGEITERFDRLEESMTKSSTKNSTSRTKKEADAE